MNPSRKGETDRPLFGECVGISIGDPGELPQLGFEPGIINVLTVDLASRLIALGASVALGHTWRPGGVMQAVASFGRSYGQNNAAPDAPLIHNVMAAPDMPALSELEQRELRSFIGFRTVAWQEVGGTIIARLRETRQSLRATPHLLQVANSSGEANRGLDLLAMRFALSRICTARIAIGGKCNGFEGLSPGIFEEAWFDTVAGHPVIASHALGGAAMFLGEGARRPPDDWSELAKAYCADLLHAGSIRVVHSLNIEELLVCLVAQLRRRGPRVS